jgi:hypothetical protein
MVREDVFRLALPRWQIQGCLFRQLWMLERLCGGQDRLMMTKKIMDHRTPLTRMCLHRNPRCPEQPGSPMKEGATRWRDKALAVAVASPEWVGAERPPWTRFSSLWLDRAESVSAPVPPARADRQEPASLLPGYAAGAAPCHPPDPPRGPPQERCLE